MNLKEDFLQVKPNHNNANYWENRWETQQTGWDIGHASSPIKEYLNGYSDKNSSILIPGCGNAHEAEFLLENGFKNITLIDIAPKAVEILHNKFKNRPEIKVLCEDFFEHQGQYDLIIEQTFFCAIHPTLRPTYAKKMAELLKNNGKLMGVLFASNFEHPGPPFGGSKEEYVEYFKSYFTIQHLEECYNSIKPRLGKELFLELIK